MSKPSHWPQRVKRPSANASVGTASKKPLLARELRFALTFVALAALLLVVYAFPYAPDGAVHRFFERYLASYARAAGALLGLFDPSIHVSGADILGRFSLRIVKDCDAMEINILFAAAVLAFPVRGWRRVAGIGVGLVALFVANLARITSLYFIGLVAPDAFETAHREVCPLLLVAVALGLFLAWAEWARSADERELHGVSG